jgi:hypothetical protein
MARKIVGLSKKEAQKIVVREIAKGASVAEAMKLVDRSVQTYENWRAIDPEFKEAVNKARGRMARAEEKQVDPELFDLDFVTWRKKFLKSDTYPHQKMWIDVLEGKEPEVYHPAITYTSGHKNRIIINTPPGHAKSTTITRDYVVYKLCMNPAFRVLIVSKTMEFATKLLFGIKQLLTDPAFAELQAAYAPSGGWRPERGEGRWGASQIYLAGRSKDAVDAGAKDPSVQAVGIGGQIYGTRTDLTILDDAIDDTNAHQYEKQFDWLTRTVLSRGRSAQVLVVGTRIQPQDLYAHLMNDDLYVNGVSPWTYLAQPAVLSFSEDPKDWITLWPKSTLPFDETGAEEPDEDGLYPVWDGPTLRKVRSENRPAVWALVYQQQQTSDDMVFPAACVWGCVNKRRRPGPLSAGAVGHPRHGAEGMHIIGSIDPAGTGMAFILVYAVDRQTKRRWVLNAWIATDTVPKWYQDKIKEITPAYGVMEWVIEKQGYSNWIYHDETIMQFCRERGVKISAHYTGAGNKVDPDFGVASMSPLFGTIEKAPDGREVYQRDGLIDIPDPDYSPGIKALIEQLITWGPGVSGAKLRQDGPMALWFAETIGRRIALNEGKPLSTHVQKNRYLSRRAQERQYVITAHQ